LLESGREVLLYRVVRGETCIFTNISILKNIPYPAYAVAEVDTTGLLLDVHAVRDFFDKYPYWRNFVIEMIAKNLYELFVMLNELLSKRVDKRLIKYLYEKSLNGRVLRLTHEDIAKDIGTVREVVSRLLKDLERSGTVELRRGEIIVRDVERLKRELSF
ncbi:MAG: Crp/Fnr family transcriptional regulator, partial [Hydrogenobacter sp.]